MFLRTSFRPSSTHSCLMGSWASLEWWLLIAVRRAHFGEHTGHGECLLPQETPPLQQQLNFPSSAASPPFTSTNPVMHNGDLSETQGPLAASSAASSALLTGNNPALRSGDLSDTSASIASSSFAPPAGKMCFNNTPRKTVESEDDFSMFSRLHTASQRSVTVSPRSLGPLQMLQTAGDVLRFLLVILFVHQCSGMFW